MDYYESAEDQTITHKRACKEVRDHGISATDPDFLAEFPSNTFPRPAQDILAWLGY